MLFPHRQIHTGPQVPQLMASQTPTANVARDREKEGMVK